MKPLKIVITIIGLILISVAFASQSGLLPYLAASRTKSSSAGVLSGAPDDRAKYNYEGVTQVASRHNVFTDYSIKRLYVQFSDIFAGIPSGSTINSAKLRLYANGYSAQYCIDYADRTYKLYRVAGYWSSNMITWNTQPSIASKETYTFSKSPKGDTGQWWEMDVTSDVKDFYSGAKTNNGWMLRETDEDHGSFTAWRYEIDFENSQSTMHPPQLVIDYFAPAYYTLTVQAKDQEGNSLSGASVTIYKDSTVVASLTTDYYGRCLKSLQEGVYSIKCGYSGQSYTQAVTLNAAKTVTFTFTIEAPPTPTPTPTPTPGPTPTPTPTTTPTPSKAYKLSLTVVDQLNRPLPASVYFDTSYATCDSLGKTSYSAIGPYTVTAHASIQVGEKTFEAEETYSISKDTSKTLTIIRRFLWTFYVNYADGNPASGTIQTTGKEALTIPVDNGRGETYLLDGTYQMTWHASPQIDLGSYTVSEDTVITVTLEKPTTDQPEGGVQTSSTTSAPSPGQTGAPVATPPPWVLLPTTHIYVLTGVLFVVGIVAIWMRTRRKK